MARQHAISKGDANAEIKRYVQLIEEAKKPEFYNGLPALIKAYLTPETLSFVFYKNQLDDIYSSVQDANAFRIYLAAKPVSTEPSLIIVPCKLSLDETYAENRLPGPPGDGGGQYPLVFPKSLHSEL